MITHENSVENLLSGKFMSLKEGSMTVTTCYAKAEGRQQWFTLIECENCQFRQMQNLESDQIVTSVPQINQQSNLRRMTLWKQTHTVWTF